VNAAVYTVSGSVSINKAVGFVITSDDDPIDNDECTVQSDGVIRNAEIDPCVWNPEEEDLEIVWELDDDVDEFTLTAEKSGEDDIELMDEEDLWEDDYDFEWDGTDDDGDEIEEGTWYIVFEADNDEVRIPVIVDYDDDNDDDDDEVTATCGTEKSLGVIDDADVDDCTWDPTEDDLTITWELNDDVDDFTLTAEKSGEDDVELMDEEDLDEDDYDFEWDGTDDDGDIIEEGTWYIVLEADDYKIRIPVRVSYDDDDDDDNNDDVEISDIFVTKTSFDNDAGEFVYVVFRTEDDAEVTVDVFKGTKKIDTLIDEEDLDGDVWHAVKWDGTDDDGDEVKEGDYKFKVTAEDGREKASKTVNVEVAEDDIASNKTNVTNDSITPVVIEKSTTTGAQITYKIDDDAEVTVAIYKGDKTSGAEIVLENKKDKKAGTYTVKWDGRDDDDDRLSKDTKYSYLITAKVDGSSTKVDKERGYFVIGEAGSLGGTTAYNCENAGFWDVSNTSPYCEAIVWAKSRGIITGYPGNYFKPYGYINRVEALAVALRAFSLPILSDNYTNLGFTDVTVGGWYMPYLRTGKFYGLVSGYGGTTLVKPASEISRVEILKFIIEAAEAAQNYEFPTCNSIYYSDSPLGAWYTKYVCVSHDYDLFTTYSGFFYPGIKATRGEVVLALYKLYQAGLLK